MVGLQCKSCGQRVLLPPDPANFKMSHEVQTMLAQSPIKCDRCGGSEHHFMVLTGGMADAWLEGGAPSSNAGPLTEGG